jgi:hypothetical protein
MEQNPTAGELPQFLSDRSYSSSTRSLITREGTLPFLSFCFVSFVYLLYINKFAVNSLYGDDYRVIPWINSSLHGSIPFQLMWNPYNIHRMFVANIILVANGVWNHDNTRSVMWLSAIILIGAFAVYLRTLKYNSTSRISPLAIFLLGLVLFSPVNYESALWDFCIEWNIILLCFLIVLWGLSRKIVTVPVYLGMVVAAVIGSFSSFDGLVIWPVAFFCLLWRWKFSAYPLRWVVLWALLASITTYFYLVPGVLGNGNTGVVSFAMHNPYWVFKFFLVLVGSVFSFSQGYVRIHEVIGCVILVVAAIVLFLDLRNTRGNRKIPYPSALILYSLICDVQISIGRSWIGPTGALTSRYSLPNLLLLLGIGAFLLSDRPPSSRTSPHWPHLETSIVPLVVWSLISIQIVVGSIYGFDSSRVFSQNRVYGAQTIVNLDKTGNEAIALVCGYVNCFVPWPIRTYSAIAKVDQLSEFYPMSLYDHYRRLGVPPLPPAIRHPPFVGPKPAPQL